MNTQSMVDFIKVNGWYPDFKKFCTTIPSVKSFKRQLYLYLIHTKKLNMFKALSNFGCLNLKYVRSIALTRWCD